MSIGERIVSLRKQSSISQGQLAQMLGITRQAVSKWENDLSSPDTLNLIRLADVLSTEIEYLATGREKSTEPEKQIIIQEKIVEKIVEVPKKVLVPQEIHVEKIVKVPVETVVEKPVIRKVVRVKYRNDPIIIGIIGAVCGLVGFLLGILL